MIHTFGVGAIAIVVDEQMRFVGVGVFVDHGEGKVTQNARFKPNGVWELARGARTS